MQRVDYRESSCLEKDPNYRDTGACRKKPKKYISIEMYRIMSPINIMR